MLFAFLKHKIWIQKQCIHEISKNKHKTNSENLIEFTFFFFFKLVREGFKERVGDGWEERDSGSIPQMKFGMNIVGYICVCVLCICILICKFSLKDLKPCILNTWVFLCVYMQIHIYVFNNGCGRPGIWYNGIEKKKNTQLGSFSLANFCPIIE